MTRLQVRHYISSAGLYGAEKMLLTLLREQAEQGFDVELCTLENEEQPASLLGLEAEKLGIPHRSIKLANRFSFRSFLAEARWGRGKRNKVLHGHGYRANVLLAVSKVILRDVATIATLHGWTSTKRLSSARAYEVLEKMACFVIDQPVVVSSAMKNMLPTLLRRKVRVIHNGIASDLPRVSMPSDIRAFIGERKSILYAGRLSFEKGIDTAIELMKKFALVNSDYVLVVCGTGPFSKWVLDQIGTYDLQDRVRLFGYVENIEAYLGEFDVLLLPSRTEGTPIIVLEAMVQEVPIVANKVGGLPEMIESSSGLLVDGTIESIASAIDVSVLQSTRLTANAKLAVKEQFSSDEMAKKYAGLYGAVLCRK